jgi:hypothetical protein
MSGLDRLGQTLDPERLRGLLARYFERLLGPSPPVERRLPASWTLDNPGVGSSVRIGVWFRGDMDERVGSGEEPRCDTGMKKEYAKDQIVVTWQPAAI